MITDGKKRQKTPSKNSKNDPGPTALQTPLEGNLFYIPSGIRGSSQCSAIGSKERITTSDTLQGREGTLRLIPSLSSSTNNKQILGKANNSRKLAQLFRDHL
ncbi:hypothetical protein Tco_0311391 [Tanacetum coccineum]